MGGGYQVLSSDAVETEDDPINKKAGIRKDGRNLIKEWFENKRHEGRIADIVRTKSELNRVHLETSDYLFGNLQFFNKIIIIAIYFVTNYENSSSI